MGYSKEAERQNKALESILRGGTPEKRVMVGYNADKGEDKNGKTIESHLTKIMQEARMPWFCPECDKVMKHRLDDKMWRLFGQCFDCQIKEENKMRIEGTYDEWARKKVLQNQISFLSDQLESLDQYAQQDSVEFYNAVNPELGYGHTEKYERSDEDKRVVMEQVTEAKGFISDSITHLQTKLDSIGEGNEVA